MSLLRKHENVANIDALSQDHLKERMSRVRETFRRLSKEPDDEALVAFVMIGVTANGSIRPTVLNIEPEFVEPIMREGQKVARRLFGFMQSRRPRHAVIDLKAFANGAGRLGLSSVKK